jgi:hypothetical protein
MKQGVRPLHWAVGFRFTGMRRDLILRCFVLGYGLFYETQMRNWRSSFVEWSFERKEEVPGGRSTPCHFSTINSARISVTMISTSNWTSLQDPTRLQLIRGPITLIWFSEVHLCCRVLLKGHSCPEIYSYLRNRKRSLNTLTIVRKQVR